MMVVCLNEIIELIHKNNNGLFGMSSYVENFKGLLPTEFAVFWVELGLEDVLGSNF